MYIFITADIRLVFPLLCFLTFFLTLSVAVHASLFQPCCSCSAGSCSVCSLRLRSEAGYHYYRIWRARQCGGCPTVRWTCNWSIRNISHWLAKLMLFPVWSNVNNSLSSNWEMCAETFISLSCFQQSLHKKIMKKSQRHGLCMCSVIILNWFCALRLLSGLLKKVCQGQHMHVIIIPIIAKTVTTLYFTLLIISICVL